MKINILFSVLLFTNMLSFKNSLAQDGSLDLSFDNDGIVYTWIGSYEAFAQSVVVQGDGKIILCGYMMDKFKIDYEFTLMRYNTNGTLDLTFNSTGMARTSISAKDDKAYSAVIQPDGKIIAVGTSGSVSSTVMDISLVRYNSDGTLDATFDNDGKVTTVVGPNVDVANSILLQPDGKILVLGSSKNATTTDLLLLRYNTNGTLDLTFDNDGIVTTKIGTSSTSGSSLALQSDGKILATGTCTSGGVISMTLARYNTDGSLDISFDNDGFTTTSIGLSASGRTVLVQDDGKIVVAGSGNIGSSYYFALVRHNSDGTLDLTFDNDGIVTTSFESSMYNYGTAAAMQGDGKIIVAGSSDIANYDMFAAARYNTDGTLDLSFDGDGMLTTNVGVGDDKVSGIALQSDGKIILGGTIFKNNTNTFSLVRYNNSEITSAVNLIDPNMNGHVYPNPCNSSCTLVFEEKINIGTLSVYDVFGQKIKSISNISGSSISVIQGDIPAGIYFCELTENNAIIFNSKILIVD
jgi:uncharacterized delta-60 repeat protein